VYVVHGLGDHSDKYAPVARQLVEAGYAVVAHDAHGHGRSDGFRGHADSMQHYVDDARLAVAEATRRLPNTMHGLPKLLLGHSLGGAVAIHLARDDIRADWAGVLLTSPAVAVYPKPLLKLFAPLIATLAPLMPVQRLKSDPRRGPPGGLGALANRVRSGSAKKRAAAAAASDPLLVRGPVRARLGYEVLKSCQRIMRHAGAFRSPVFVAHSKDDRVTNCNGSIKFCDRIASTDKIVRLYDGNAHDLLADPRQSKQVVRDMIEWADARVAIASSSKEAALQAGR
jgi:acylglycerol lipase